MLDIQPHLLCPTSLACCQVSYEELLKNLIVAMAPVKLDLTCREYRWFHAAPEQTYIRGVGPHPGPLAHCPPHRKNKESVNQSIKPFGNTYNQT